MQSLGLMKKRSPVPEKANVYEAPYAFVLAFYGLLIAWTVTCIYLIGTKAISAQWPVGLLVMIGFIIAYTWYWCLGISYRIVVRDSGDIELKSLRRTLHLKPSEVLAVESPRRYLIPTVFIRFRMARERAYIFCVISSADISYVFKVMQENNTELHFKGFAGVL